MVADGPGFVHRFVPAGTARGALAELRGQFRTFPDPETVIPGDNPFDRR